MQPTTPAAKSQLPKVIEILQAHQSGVICLPSEPTQDAIAAASALYLGLTQIGHNVAIVCANAVHAPYKAADKITSEFATPGDSLVVSFPYEDGSVDKVDYYIQNDRFNVVITPRPGYEKLDQTKVTYGYTGGTVEYVVTIDAPSLRALGDLHTNNQEQFKNKKIINIDRHLTNTFFGAANLVNRNVSSESELILQLLEGMKIAIDKDMATNILAGIIASTANYQAPHTNAGSFETSAKLMNLGATKPRTETAPSADVAQAPSAMSMPQATRVTNPYAQMPQQYQQAPAQMPPQAMQQPMRTPAAPYETVQPHAQQANMMPSLQSMMQQPQQLAPMQMQSPTQMPPIQQPMQQMAQPIAQDPVPYVDPFDEDFDDEDDDDDDWLKPQIFNPPATSPNANNKG